MTTVIVSDPEILGGTPVFAGTRVPIESLFDALKHDRTVEYFLQQFPSVSRPQVEALLELAKRNALERRVSA